MNAVYFGVCVCACVCVCVSVCVYVCVYPYMCARVERTSIYTACVVYEHGSLLKNSQNKYTNTTMVGARSLAAIYKLVVCVMCLTSTLVYCVYVCVVAYCTGTVLQQFAASAVSTLQPYPATLHDIPSLFQPPLQ